MYAKLGMVIAALALITGLIYFGVSWADRGHEIVELKKTVKLQDQRYMNLVDRARQIQETLKAQQTLTLEWQTKYNDLASLGPEIRERTRTVVERVPEYISVEVENQRAEEAMWGLAAFVSMEIAPMVEAGDE